MTLKPSRSNPRHRSFLVLKYMILLFGIMIVPVMSYIPQKIRSRILNFGVTIVGRYNP